MASQPKLGFSCLFLHVPTRLTPAVVLIPCGPNILERDPPRVPGLLWAPTYRERWIEGKRLRRIHRAERKLTKQQRADTRVLWLVIKHSKKVLRIRPTPTPPPRAPLPAPPVKKRPTAAMIKRLADEKLGLAPVLLPLSVLELDPLAEKGDAGSDKEGLGSDPVLTRSDAARARLLAMLGRMEKAVEAEKQRGVAVMDGTGKKGEATRVNDVDTGERNRIKHTVNLAALDTSAESGATIRRCATYRRLVPGLKRRAEI